MKDSENLENSVDKKTNKGLSFFGEMRRVKWSNLNKVGKTFLVTIIVILVFSLLFFGFDALIGVIFDGIGVL
ncbi:MAG: preprotein translocase subunit SecE [Mycoplasmataceae bacterium]|nr:preprotein translocase subunit SecE [Mycoplasmataceae bacterium]